jgi:Domain of unknown function (DUF1857)
MRQVSFSAKVHATRETVWQLLVDKVEKPAGYIPGVTDVKIVERYDDGVLREVRTQGMVMKERVTLDEAHGEVRYLLLEHPLFSGQVINRVVPTSVQNPVAPVVLTISLDWGPKDESAEKIIQTELPAQIQREVLSLKERAEELERSS